MCQGYLNVFENICCFVGESPADGFLELHEGDELQELKEQIAAMQRKLDSIR